MMLANGMCLSCRQFRDIAILKMQKKGPEFSQVLSVSRSCSFEPKNCKELKFQQFYIANAQDDTVRRMVSAMF